MKRFIAALRNTILTCAIIHLILITIYAVLNKNLNRINGFDILDIDLFFPYVGVGVFYFIASYLFIGSVYLYYYLRAKKRKK